MPGEAFLLLYLLLSAFKDFEMIGKFVLIFIHCQEGSRQLEPNFERGH